MPNDNMNPAHGATMPGEKPDRLPQNGQNAMATTGDASQTLPTLSHAEQQWRLDERKAMVLAKASDAIPRAFRGKPGDIMAAWLMADELGISRMAMLRGAYVIQGKPQLSGDLLLAVARANGVRVMESFEEDANNDENIIAICHAVCPDGHEVRQAYSTADAKVAGLWESSEPWRKYPSRMLKMRARGWCLRDAIPDKLAGVYAEGEIIDITPEQSA